MYISVVHDRIGMLVVVVVVSSCFALGRSSCLVAIVALLLLLLSLMLLWFLFRSSDSRRSRSFGVCRWFGSNLDSLPFDRRRSVRLRLCEAISRVCVCHDGSILLSNRTRCWF